MTSAVGPLYWRERLGSLAYRSLGWRHVPWKGLTVLAGPPNVVSRRSILQGAAAAISSLCYGRLATAQTPQHPQSSTEDEEVSKVRNLCTTQGWGG